jgi:hypothetical protein
VLAYSSSRIHVIDVTGPDVTVTRELKILRRPASTTITDDGSLLAVLSTDLQVDLYDLTGEHPKHTKVVSLDHTPRTIALSPTGSVLAAAYDSGVEVSSLDPGCTSTDRRAVKCYAVDSLSFSRDGTQLLGTTIESRNPSTVVLTAPYYDPGGSLPEESVSALWTTSILFPNGSRDCSHAVLLPSSGEEEASWTFTYDRVFETFRAVRIDDLRNGTTYFTGPIADSRSVSKLLPSTLPTASESGDLVASGFQGAIWLYGVPEDLEALPNLNLRDDANSTQESGVSTPLSQLGRRNSAPSLRSVNRQRESISRVPQWQLLCDRLRNTFVEGRKIGSLDRVSAMTWVNARSTSFHGERLVAVAPGVGGQAPSSEDDGMSPVDGGRIAILDFDYSLDDGKKDVVTIEVGNREPEILEEEHRDLDTEVAIVRRRTVAQRRGVRTTVSRSATTVARSARSDVPPMPTIQDLGDPYSSAIRTPRRQSQQTTATENSETVSIDEESEAFDAPYSHTSPRSGTTLRRAATAAAVNRRFHPRAGQEHIEYRRADGREEHPHESDADNWVPPPPPYSRDPVPPLPEHIQRSLLAEAAAASLHRANTQRAPSLDFPGLDSSTLSRSRTVASSSTGSSRRERFTFNRNRTMSDSTIRSVDRLSFEEDEARPVTSPVSPDLDDDIYDVSPPGTPQQAPRRVAPVAPVNQIPRRPVGAPPGAPVTSSSPVSSNGSPPAPEPDTPAPSMRATISQPISPVPQPSRPVDETLNNRMREKEVINEPQQVSPRSEVPPSSVDVPLPDSSSANPRRQSRNSIVRDSIILNKEVPARPDEAHHLTELPPSTPIVPNQQKIIESQLSESSILPRHRETAPVTTSAPQDMHVEPLPIWRRSDTAPAPSGAQNGTTTSPALLMPSADQLARLNSRKGRPSGITDPRRYSGSSNHQPNLSSGSDDIRRFSGGPNHEPQLSSSSHNRGASWGSIQNTPPRNITKENTPPRLTPEQAFRNSQPRAAVAAYGPSPQRSGPAYPPSSNTYSNTPSRRVSNGNSLNRNVNNGSPGLRPPMQRLETIHSQSSASGEPSPYFAQKAIMIGRQPSRAERSAAKNIKDAKKRGWRASMRKEEKKKEKFGDAASSAGWTDVSTQSGMRYWDRDAQRKEKSNGKCVVM